MITVLLLFAPGGFPPGDHTDNVFLDRLAEDKEDRNGKKYHGNRPREHFPDISLENSRTLLLDNSVASPIVKPVRVRRFKAYQYLYLVRRKDSPMTPDMKLLWDFVQSGSWLDSTAAFPPELP